jgi:hypothetical protein
MYSGSPAVENHCQFTNLTRVVYAMRKPVVRRTSISVRITCFWEAIPKVGR